MFTEGYKFSESGNYYAPDTGNIEHFRGFIKEHLPFSDQPEVFGMHENAEITSGVGISN